MLSASRSADCLRWALGDHANTYRCAPAFSHRTARSATRTNDKKSPRTVFVSLDLRIARRPRISGWLRVVEPVRDTQNHWLDQGRSRRFVRVRLSAGADGRRARRGGRHRAGPGAAQHAASRAGVAADRRSQSDAAEPRYARFDRLARRRRRTGDRVAARFARPLRRRPRARHVDQRGVVDQLAVRDPRGGHQSANALRSSARAGRAICRRA